MAYGILYDYLMGQSIRAFDYFGAHFGVRETETVVETTLKNGRKRKKKVVTKEEGVWFRLYAPMADDVSLIGEWNGWDVRKDKLSKVDPSGTWETFIPGLHDYQCYKYHFKNAHGQYVDKADPFAFYSEMRPQSCSRLFDVDHFIWHDEAWLKTRTRNFDKPMSIYECHLGSWKGKIGDRYPSYEEAADFLIPYLKDLGYTHVEIMPISQYPFDGSWGYQATGFYSVDSRYGNPKQLMSFVDRLHAAGFGVILGFRPGPFRDRLLRLKRI
jgi:1,4-alpha-glucan branching enzyme